MHLDHDIEFDVHLVQRLDHVVAQIVVRRSQRQARNLPGHAGPGIEGVLHGLPLAEQIGHAAIVALAKRIALGLIPQRLHPEVEQMVVARVEEIPQGRLLKAPDLQPGVGTAVWGDEGRRADAEEILSVRLVLHQLGPRHAHHLDGHAHEADVIDVLGHCGSGTGIAHPGGKAPRRGEDTTAQVRRQAAADGNLASHQAMGLGVAAALKMARSEVADHLVSHARDNRGDVRLFIGIRRSSASARFSRLRPRLIRVWMTAACGPRNRASKGGRKKGSKRRSTRLTATRASCRALRIMAMSFPKLAAPG